MYIAPLMYRTANVLRRYVLRRLRVEHIRAHYGWRSHLSTHNEAHFKFLAGLFVRPFQTCQHVFEEANHLE
jgi:hypothetical protein